MRDSFSATRCYKKRTRFPKKAPAGLEKSSVGLSGAISSPLPPRLNLYQAYCFFFREKIKRDGRIFNLLTRHALVAINAKLDELKPGAQRIELRFELDKFTEWLGGRLGELRRWLDQHFRELQSRI